MTKARQYLFFSSAMQEGGVAAVRVEGKFVFDSANHRDFLGACLGTGIERSRVGDILVLGEDGAQIFITPELAQHLVLNLVQVSFEIRACSHERETKSMATHQMLPRFLSTADFRLLITFSWIWASVPIRYCKAVEADTGWLFYNWCSVVKSTSLEPCCCHSLISLVGCLVCEKSNSKHIW